MSGPEGEPPFDFLDPERQQAIDRLTGINSSRKTYYPALREKVRELEESNELLRRAREEAEALSLELQKAVTRTSAVLNATRHINRYLGLRELLRETLGILTGEMGYAWAAIHVFRDDRGQRELLVESAGKQPGRGHLLPSPEVLAADPHFLRARRSGEAVLADHPEISEGAPLLFLPLLAGRGTGGMLVVGAERFLPEDLDVLQGVAQSLALAMENAVLYRRVSSQARRLDYTLVTIDSLSRTLTRTTHGLAAFLQELVSTVERVTVAQHVVFLGTDLAGPRAGGRRMVPLWWSGRAPEQGFPLDPEEPVPGLTAALETADEPFWLEEALLEGLRGEGARLGLAGRGFVRTLCIPMRRGRALEGAVLAFFNTLRELAPREREMLTILGNQVSVGLENTQLYEKGERLRRQAEQHYQVAMEQKRQAEASYEELQKARHRMRAIDEQRILQEERARIAQELHDSVAQVIYSLGLNLDWCRSQAPEGSALHERLGVLKEMAAGCVQEMRQSIFELAPSVPDHGLAVALAKLVEDYPRQTGIRLLADIAPELPELSRSEQSEIYRIVQESLFNIFKHAQAQEATLRLQVIGSTLQVQISDDGVGMAAARGEPGGDTSAVRREPRAGMGGFGLSGMRRRAEALGASLTVESEAGRGTRIRLDLPLPGSAASPVAGGS